MSPTVLQVSTANQSTAVQNVDFTSPTMQFSQSDITEGNIRLHTASSEPTKGFIPLFLTYAVALRDL